MRVKVRDIREGQTISWGRMPPRAVVSIERAGHGRIFYFADGSHDYLGFPSKVDVHEKRES